MGNRRSSGDHFCSHFKISASTRAAATADPFTSHGAKASTCTRKAQAMGAAADGMVCDPHPGKRRTRLFLARQASGSHFASGLALGAIDSGSYGSGCVGFPAGFASHVLSLACRASRDKADALWSVSLCGPNTAKPTSSIAWSKAPTSFAVGWPSWPAPASVCSAPWAERSSCSSSPPSPTAS